MLWGNIPGKPHRSTTVWSNNVQFLYIKTHTIFGSHCIHWLGHGPSGDVSDIRASRIYYLRSTIEMWESNIFVVQCIFRYPPYNHAMIPFISSSGCFKKLPAFPITPSSAIYIWMTRIEARILLTKDIDFSVCTPVGLLHLSNIMVSMRKKLIKWVFPSYSYILLVYCVSSKQDRSSM